MKSSVGSCWEKYLTYYFGRTRFLRLLSAVTRRGWRCTGDLCALCSSMFVLLHYLRQVVIFDGHWLFVFFWQPVMFSYVYLVIMFSHCCTCISSLCLLFVWQNKMSSSSSSSSSMEAISAQSDTESVFFHSRGNSARQLGRTKATKHVCLSVLAVAAAINIVCFRRRGIKSNERYQVHSLKLFQEKGMPFVFLHGCYLKKRFQIQIL